VISIPYCTCHCGCGQPTRVPTKDVPAAGQVKGVPLRYIDRHQGSTFGPDYRIEDRGYSTPCWVWAKRMLKSGYGAMRVNRRQQRAHRVYYERANGPIPEGQEPDHKCKQKACVNPEHLEPVTHTENMRRARHVKMNLARAEEIRERLRGQGHGILSKLAREYDVSVSTIWLIAKDKIWSQEPTL
jgi:hypothetical protein